MDENLFEKPQVISCNDDYYNFIQKHLVEYIIYSESIINSLFDEEHISNIDVLGYKDKINESKKLILRILYSFNKGDRFKSIEGLKDFILNFAKDFLTKEPFTFKIEKGEIFYRIRCDKAIEIESRSKYAIFHIPFNKRYLVNNLRFNPPGIPGFYCSNKLITCWLECNKPTLGSGFDDNKMNVGVFKNCTTIEGIDISIRSIENLRNRSNKSEVLGYLVLYPLIMLLHTKIEYENKPKNFQYEYLFPSMLMDWIMNQKNKDYVEFGKEFDFMKYSSVESSDQFIYHNYVFPTTFEDNIQYCSNLEKLFLEDNKYFFVNDLFSIINKENIDESDIDKIEKELLKHQV